MLLISTPIFAAWTTVRKGSLQKRQFFRFLKKKLLPKTRIAIYSHRPIIQTSRSNKIGLNYWSKVKICFKSKICWWYSKLLEKKQQIPVSFAVWKWELASHCISASAALSVYRVPSVLTALWITPVVVQSLIFTMLLLSCPGDCMTCVSIASLITFAWNITDQSALW